ncbi:hypothetical protein ONZ45_g16197 [Pleurotus djamor]|nr:hypothetical protein ONZ45_g16197 [Pleurotus djamor]
MPPKSSKSSRGRATTQPQAAQSNEDTNDKSQRSKKSTKTSEAATNVNEANPTKARKRTYAQVVSDGESSPPRTRTRTRAQAKAATSTSAPSEETHPATSEASRAPAVKVAKIGPPRKGAPREKPVASSTSSTKTLGPDVDITMAAPMSPKRPVEPRKKKPRQVSPSPPPPIAAEDVDNSTPPAADPAQPKSKGKKKAVDVLPDPTSPAPPSSPFSSPPPSSPPSSSRPAPVISRSRQPNELSVDTRLVDKDPPPPPPNADHPFERFEQDHGPLIQMSPSPSPPPCPPPRKAKVNGLAKLQQQPRPRSPQSDAGGSDYADEHDPGTMDEADDDDDDDDQAGDDEEATTSRSKSKGKAKAKDPYLTGPVPRHILDRVAELENTYRTEVEALAQQCNKSSATLFKAVGSIVNRRRPNDYNICASVYARGLGPNHKSSSTEFKVKWQEIKQLPEAEYDAYVKKARKKFHENHVKSIDWLKEEGLYDTPLKKTAQYLTNISRNIWDDNQVHVVSYLISRAKNDEGRALNRMVSGSPLADAVIKNPKFPSIRRHMELLEAYIIAMENNEPEESFLRPSDGLHGYLSTIAFEVPGKDARDHRRTLIGIILLAQISFILASRWTPDSDEVKTPPRIEWSKWFLQAYKLQLCLINWPDSEVFPKPGSTPRSLWIDTKDDDNKNTDKKKPEVPKGPPHPRSLAPIIKAYKKVADSISVKNKDTQVDWKVLSDVVQIVSWTNEQRARAVEDQGDIPLVIGKDGTVLVKVSTYHIAQYQAALDKTEKMSRRAATFREDPPVPAPVPTPTPTPHSPSPPPSPRARPKPRPRTKAASSSTVPIEGPAVGADGQLKPASQISWSESATED